MEDYPVGTETEEKRAYARRKLRGLTERKLKRHGQPSLAGPAGGIDAGWRLKDGSPAHMLQIQQGRETIVQIIVYKTEDSMGPMTQYSSRRPGSFTRLDTNPIDSGALPQAEAEDLGEKAGSEAFLAGAIVAGAEILQNLEEGIDGHEITAAEARELFDQVQGGAAERF
ncbi:MAG: hypothetical protein ACREJM_02955 [Candidatus Saccharimonadales bacterium]